LKQHIKFRDTPLVFTDLLFVRRRRFLLANPLSTPDKNA